MSIIGVYNLLKCKVTAEVVNMVEIEKGERYMSTIVKYLMRKEMKASDL